MINVNKWFFKLGVCFGLLILEYKLRFFRFRKPSLDNAGSIINNNSITFHDFLKKFSKELRIKVMRMGE